MTDDPHDALFREKDDDQLSSTREFPVYIETQKGGHQQILRVDVYEGTDILSLRGRVMDRMLGGDMKHERFSCYLTWREAYQLANALNAAASEIRVRRQEDD